MDDGLEYGAAELMRPAASTADRPTSASDPLAELLAAFGPAEAATPSATSNAGRSGPSPTGVAPYSGRWWPAPCGHRLHRSSALPALQGRHPQRVEPDHPARRCRRPGAAAAAAAMASGYIADENLRAGTSDFAVRMERPWVDMLPRVVRPRQRPARRHGHHLRHHQGPNVHCRGLPLRLVRGQDGTLGVEVRRLHRRARTRTADHRRQDQHALVRALGSLVHGGHRPDGRRACTCSA